MSANPDPYRFPDTLNGQKRILGLPPEEFTLLALCGVAGFWFDILMTMIVVGGALWLLLRHLKKGQGTWWLLNLLWWYLPTAVFRMQFRKVPDSSRRHWMP